MKSVIPFMMQVVFLCSCGNASERSIEAIDNVTNARRRDSHGSILVSSSQLSSFRRITLNGCDFELVMIDTDTIYLATHDKAFQTPEGYGVGTTLGELPKDIRSELREEHGWGYYLQLASGWSLGFCEGSSCSDNYPLSSSHVRWIFKRQ